MSELIADPIAMRVAIPVLAIIIFLLGGIVLRRER